MVTESGSGCGAANFDGIKIKRVQRLNGLVIQHQLTSTELVHALDPIRDWFEHQGWTPLPFQEATWRAYLEGRSGLIQVPTGSGKTFAAVMGPMARMLAEEQPLTGIRLVYITPLRALSRDLSLAIREPIEAMGWPIRVGIRNGDSSSSERTKQLKAPPQILVTTPERSEERRVGKECER